MRKIAAIFAGKKGMKMNYTKDMAAHVITRWAKKRIEYMRETQGRLSPNNKFNNFGQKGKYGAGVKRIGPG